MFWLHNISWWNSLYNAFRSKSVEIPYRVHVFLIKEVANLLCTTKIILYYLFVIFGELSSFLSKTQRVKWAQVGTKTRIKALERIKPLSITFNAKMFRLGFR